MTDDPPVNPSDTPEAQKAQEAPHADTPENPRSAATATQPAPAKPKTRPLPPWKVILHNDDVNDLLFVVQTVHLLTPLNQREAAERTMRAHLHGLALLLTTHRERAELYQQQFASRGLTVTIEPA